MVRHNPKRRPENLQKHYKWRRLKLTDVAETADYFKEGIIIPLHLGDDKTASKVGVAFADSGTVLDLLRVQLNGGGFFTVNK